MKLIDDGEVVLRTAWYRLFLTLLLALAVPLTVAAQSLDQAAREAARQYDAKILSARTIDEGGREVHVIKLLTRDGIVKTVRIAVPKKQKPH
jgi:hypothetical protein